MRPLFSFIFNILTDLLSLPVSWFWECLILAVTGKIAFAIAWEASPGGFFGSAVHWSVRAIAFFAIWAVEYFLIWIIKMIIN